MILALIVRLNEVFDESIGAKPGTEIGSYMKKENPAQILRHLHLKVFLITWKSFPLKLMKRTRRKTRKLTWKLSSLMKNKLLHCFSLTKLQGMSSIF